LLEPLGYYGWSTWIGRWRARTGETVAPRERSTITA
jgi:hypothetical protein